MPQVINLNDTTPSAPANHQNLPWKADAPNPDPTVARNVAVSVPVMDATHGGIVPTPSNVANEYLSGQATYTKPVPDLPADATKYLDGTGAFSRVPVVTTTVRGLVPDPPNDATKFLNGTGVFSTPSGGGGGGGGGVGSLLGSRRTNRMVCKQKTAGALTEIGDVINVLGTQFTAWEAPNTTQGQSTSYDNASADTACGWQGNTSLNYLLGNNLHMFAEAYLGSITDIIFMVGLFSNSGLGGTTLTSLYNDAYIRFDIQAGDTFFTCITDDGFGGRATTVTAVAPVALTSYRFLILLDDTAHNVKFYINDTLVATHTTHLPGTTQRVIWQVSGAWHTSAGSPTIGISEVAVQSDK